MNEKHSKPPSTSEQFNKVYSFPYVHWLWSDIRIPKELTELVKTKKPKSSLELGCGLGRYSTFLANQGIRASAVDFSFVAIERARTNSAKYENKPEFLVGDVTNLETIKGPFDISFDVGCFHCLNEVSQQKYVSEVYRLLKPGGTHLIWALDSSPGEMNLNPPFLAKSFEKGFLLVDSMFSRRRIVASHWYWLVRNK